MGVFDALPLDQSPMTAAALSEKLNVEKNLLGEFAICLYLILLAPLNLVSYLTAILYRSSIHESSYHCRSFCGNWSGRIQPHAIFSRLHGSSD